MIEFDEDKEKKRVQDLNKEDEEELAQLFASQNNLEYVNFAVTPVNSDSIRLIDEKKAREAKLVVYNKVDRRVDVGLLSPENPAAQAILKELEDRGYNPVIAIVSQNSLDHGWETYKDLSFASETKAGSLEVSNEEITNFMGKVKNVEDVKKYITDLLAHGKGYRISNVFEIIIAGALATGASDIHIEPEQDYVRLRYRLDGVLNNILNFDNSVYGLLLSRIKLLSGMKLNIKKDAQDGRFSVDLNDVQIEIRASSLPGAYNESIVLRVLNPKSISVPLEELGIPPKLLKILEHEIAKPNGMILNTGPTGSGKTTTLYAFLRKVHTPDIKIITIEDPIEYHLPGIVQTQTDSEKGYTFLSGLRAALRQDPDIIMIGEIRDNETAEIAINSALTGHLVFSTLHTNEASGTFPRLIDLGANPKVLSSAINIAMAQRLVRKLCQFCKKEAPIEGDLKTLITKIAQSITDKEYTYQLDKQWLPVGCEKCNKIGYKGRIGIYEAILLDHAVEEVVMNNPSEREIEKAAQPQAILNMKQDGILKVLGGITSVEELVRVIELEDKK